MKTIEMQERNGNEQRTHWIPPEWVVRREEVEPWPEAVDGRALLDELKATVSRFVVLPSWAGEAVALWIVHTYAFGLRDVTTYLGIESPQHRCGKSTLLDVMGLLVNRPVRTANISSSAFFRVIAETQPALLIDEADTFLKSEELRGILNSGYQRGGSFVMRVTSELGQGKIEERKSKIEDTKMHKIEDEEENEDDRKRLGVEDDRKGRGIEDEEENEDEDDKKGQKEGKGNRPSCGSRLVKFSCWCPKAIARIGHLPQTLADRCIVFVMQRKLAGEKCARLKSLDAEALRRKCVRFVKDHEEEIRRSEPALPGDLNDRASDIWEPLLALADLAGGDWPGKARQAAVGLSAKAQENDPMGSLLMDIAELFFRWNKERAFTEYVVTWLNMKEDRPWMVMKQGKEVKAQWLSQRLQGYGIRPKTLRIGEERKKGYELEDFREVFRRYIPRGELEAFRNEIAEQAVMKKQEEGERNAEVGGRRSEVGGQRSEVRAQGR